MVSTDLNQAEDPPPQDSSSSPDPQPTEATSGEKTKEDHMNTLILQLKKVIPLRLIVFAVGSFAFCPQMQSTTDTPDPSPLPGSNTADGHDALASITTGIHNSAFGWSSLSSNGAANFNTGVGSGTLLVNTANENTAVGAAALPNNTTANNNTATGAFALFSNTTGTSNTAVGDRALQNNTTGTRHTAVGFQALMNCIAPPDFEGNTAIGARALANDTTGNFNTAVGPALISNTTGSVNTAVGLSTLAFNTAGSSNTATGGNALFNNTTGIQNTATGVNALLSNTTGGLNTAVGLAANTHNITGNSNTAVGANTFINQTSGDGNVALGSSAGSGVVTASNVIAIGHPGADVSATTWIGNVFGVTTVSGTTLPVIVSNTGQLGTVASSERFKKDISTMEKASEAILSFRPVTFHYKTDTQDTPQFGLIAEEVAKVNPALVLPDKEGKPYTVRYDAVNAMLLNEFLKEHRTVQEQRKEIDALRAELKEQRALIQKVSDKVEFDKPAPQTVLNSR
jgi:hypothetical protein